MNNGFRSTSGAGVRIETLVFLQVMVLALALMALLQLRQYELSGFDLGATPESLAREAVLLSWSQIADDTLHSIRVNTSPGQPTPWTELVRANHTYRYVGDQDAVCRRIVEELTARGMAINDDEPECARDSFGDELSAEGASTATTTRCQST